MVGSSLEDLLLRTSRTFALSIPLLPEPTRRQVGVAYLLFRIADTLEDATRWIPERQVAELERFSTLVAVSDAAAARSAAAAWTRDPPLDHAGYLELLAHTPSVLDWLVALDSQAARVVVAHTRRTIDRMSSFAARRDREGRLALSDVADLQAYCYAVAGIVGEMLTELFLLGRDDLAAIAPALRRDAAAFGEALQLVNILKDAATDAGEGRSFLPRDTERSAVFALARRDLEIAAAYVARLHAAGAARGIVEFTALPALLARATLDRVDARGSGAKLERHEVAAIVAEMRVALDRGRCPLPRP